MPAERRPVPRRRMFRGSAGWWHGAPAGLRLAFHCRTPRLRWPGPNRPPTKGLSVPDQTPVSAAPPGSRWSTADTEPVVCCVCGRAGEVMHHVPPFGVVRCPSCTLVFVSPRLHSAALQRLYDEPAYFDGGVYGDHSRWSPAMLLQRTWTQGRLAGIPAAARRPGRLLEIGSGYGLFLAAARDAGYSVAGVELSRTGVRVARERWVSTSSPVRWPTPRPSRPTSSASGTPWSTCPTRWRSCVRSGRGWPPEAGSPCPCRTSRRCPPGCSAPAGGPSSPSSTSGTSPGARWRWWPPGPGWSSPTSSDHRPTRRMRVGWTRWWRSAGRWRTVLTEVGSDV